jgi:signal transduction histidine kinase
VNGSRVPPAADEIRALAVTLSEMLDRLAGAQERQRSFVAHAAHELSSPLAVISVSDDGPGIAPEDREPGFRALHQAR